MLGSEQTNIFLQFVTGNLLLYNITTILTLNFHIKYFLSYLSIALYNSVCHGKIEREATRAGQT